MVRKSMLPPPQITPNLDTLKTEANREGKRGVGVEAEVGLSFLEVMRGWDADDVQRK
jgi:hypothetical protein